MADIVIRHAHNLSEDEARRAAHQVAEQLAQDYQLDVAWDGDVMHFQRAGVSGVLVLAPQRALVEVRLGFLFKAFASSIEEKLAAKMRKVFA